MVVTKNLPFLVCNAHGRSEKYESSTRELHMANFSCAGFTLVVHSSITESLVLSGERCGTQVCYVAEREILFDTLLLAKHSQLIFYSWFHLLAPPFSSHSRALRFSPKVNASGSEGERVCLPPFPSLANVRGHECER